MTKKKGYTLKQIRINIAKEVPWVDIKPYSHNIISILLRMASEDYGVKEANQIVDDLNLKKLGWHKETVK